MPDVNLNLHENVIPSSKELRGESSWTLPAEGRVRVQTKYPSEDIDNILDETVPAGKEWRVSVLVNIIETDA